MRHALLASLAILAAYLFVAGRSTLFDRDEPRFAEATVEMVASGNCLYPTFDGELRPDKPILIYWLMSLPVRVFGAGERSVRSWSPIGIALAALATFAIGRRAAGERAGLAALGLLACAPLALVEGTIATTDAVLLAALTGSLFFFARSLERGARAADTLGLALSLAAALLVKGPVGLLLFTCAAALAFCSLRRRVPRGVWLSTSLAALGACALFLAWALPANAATGGEFAARGLGHHFAERAVQPLEGHGGSFLASLPFYLPVLLFGCAPWSALLPAAVSAATGKRSVEGPARALLLAWTAAVLLVMTLSATKLPHYVLPAWPALAVLVAAYLEAEREGALSAADLRWRARGRWILAGVAACEVGSLAALAWRPPFEGLRAAPIVGAALFTIAGVIGWRAQRGVWLVCAAHTAALLATILLALPAITATQVSPPLAAAIRARTTRDVPVARYRFVEPSFDFYLGRPPIETLESEDEVRAWSRREGPGVLVLPRERTPAFDAAASSLEELASVRGYNFSKGRFLELVALGRGLASRAEAGSR